MAMVPAMAARGMAFRLGSYAMRGAARRPRYKLPSWLTAANVAGAYKASRSARARMSTYAKRAVGRLSRKRAQGQARRKAVGKKRLRGAVAKPPTTPSAVVPARYAVAASMTKFKKAKKVTAQKQPKGVSVHYKDFGEFNAEKCLWINHEHWGNTDRLWYGIGLGLAKKILAFGKVYNGKSLEDPCIGPKTNTAAWNQGLQDKSGVAARIKLVYTRELADGQTTLIVDDIEFEDITTSPDSYRSMDDVAKDIRTSLINNYNGVAKTWLQSATIQTTSVSDGHTNTAMPVFIQNLDDAEICMYVSSLLKFQNITVADHGGASAFDANAIDANPLTGRVYSGKGQHPIIDGDLARMGDNTLDSFFGDVNATTGGITLLGYANTHTADDIGRIQHIPAARQIYGNQTVTSGVITMPPGAEKFHKTYFTMKKTFRSLADVCTRGSIGSSHDLFNEEFGRHTMFGLTTSHRHGEDTVKLGYNRDVNLSCHIKYKRNVYPLKTNYTLDNGLTTTTIVATEHQMTPA